MYRIKLRRDSKIGWLGADPVLEEGEPGFEKDTGKLKIGDGLSRWSSLDYFVPGEPIVSPEVNTDGITDEQILAHINSTNPHPIYDDGPSLLLLYQNAKV